MPISGALCESRWSWPSVFYFHGAATTLLFILFGALYRNSPRKHPCVGSVEMNKISVGKSSLNKDQLRKIPYSDILKTASVWAVWIGALGNFTAVNLMFLYSPTYMSKVLGFPVHQSGNLFKFDSTPLAYLYSGRENFFAQTAKP
jgi:sugar phosphate permease